MKSINLKQIILFKTSWQKAEFRERVQIKVVENKLKNKQSKPFEVKNWA